MPYFDEDRVEFEVGASFVCFVKGHAGDFFCAFDFGDVRVVDDFNFFVLFDAGHVDGFWSDVLAAVDDIDFFCPLG